MSHPDPTSGAVRDRLRQPTAVTLFSLFALVAINAQAASKVEKDLIALQQEWATARVNGDVAFLERLYSREFWMTAMDGTVVERGAAIAMFSSQETKLEAITDEDVKVVVDGLTAIMTGRENVKGTNQGVSSAYALRFTNIFVRRHKTWQLLTHHATRITDED